MKKLQMFMAVLAVVVAGAACESYHTYTVPFRSEIDDSLEKNPTVLEGLDEFVAGGEETDEIQVLQQRIADLEKAIGELKNVAQSPCAEGECVGADAEQGTAQDTDQDTTAPFVTAITPSDDAVVASSLEVVLVSFNESMDYASVKAALQIKDQNGYAVANLEIFALAESDTPLCCRSFAVALPGPLMPNTTYHVTIAESAKDLVGNAMSAGFSSSFVTGTAGSAGESQAPSSSRFVLSQGPVSGNAAPKTPPTVLWVKFDPTLKGLFVKFSKDVDVSAIVEHDSIEITGKGKPTVTPYLMPGGVLVGFGGLGIIDGETLEFRILGADLSEDRAVRDLQGNLMAETEFFTAW